MVSMTHTDSKRRSMTVEAQRLVSQAVDGDQQAMAEIETAIGVLRVMRILRDKRSLKKSLVFLARHYFNATQDELAKMFGVSVARVSQQTRRVNGVPKD